MSLSVSSSFPLSLNANNLTSLSFPSLNNPLQYLILVRLQTPLSLDFPLITFGLSLCPVTKNTGSLEVACSNGFLAFCFMLCSPARHLLLPAALGCVVTCSLRSFSSDRSNTLNRSSFARDSMMIEEILAPTKDTVRFHFCSPSSDLFSLLCLAPFHPLCPTFSSFSQSLITFSFLDILTVAVWFSAVFLSVAW